MHVVAQERRVVVVRDEDALSAHRVVGCKRPLQLRVGDLRLQMSHGSFARHAGQERIALEDGPANLVLEPDPPAVGPRQQGEAVKQRPFALGKRSILFTHHPVGAALEYRQAPHHGCDARNDLDRAGRISDDRDILASNVVGVVPASRMEPFPLEILEPGDLRDERTAELTDRTHEDFGLEVL